MLTKLKLFLTGLGNEFMKSSRAMKIIVTVLMLSCTTLGVVACSGYGPNKDFVYKMKVLSDEKLNTYKDLVVAADRSQLAALLGKEKDLYKSVSEWAFERLKKQAVREIDSYIFVIEQTHALIKGKSK